jgi:anti-sigma B factor antagonist
MRMSPNSHASKDALSGTCHAVSAQKSLPVSEDARPGLRLGTWGWLTVIGFVNVQELSDEEIVRELGERLVGLVDEGHRHVVINLVGVTLVSGYLVGQLVWLHRKVSREGGVFRICGPDPMVRRIFSICGLDRVFEIYESEREALIGGKVTRR